TLWPSPCLLCVFTPSAPTALHTLSLHDALPIWAPDSNSRRRGRRWSVCTSPGSTLTCSPASRRRRAIRRMSFGPGSTASSPVPRSEEHTSELQSRFDLVCRLLLEKKKRERARRG